MTTAWQSIDLESRLAWSRRWMRRTAAAAGALPDLTAARLAVTTHVDLKAAVFLQGLREAGAELIVHPADPATTQADVAELLAEWGIAMGSVDDCLDWEPSHTVEMGGDLVVEATRRRYEGLIASGETTRTGVNRIKAVELRHPVFDLDDVPVKNQVHNRYGVGSSTWQTVMSRTQLSLHGLCVLVIGYGEVGAGLARTARQHGAQVLVAELDPARRLIASYEGYRLGTAAELAVEADLVVTATGRAGSVSAEVIAGLRDGCLLVNAGHAPDEIDLVALGTGQPVLPMVTSHRGVLLFAGGHVANLAAGDGDSLNSFDVTAALIVEATGWLVTRGGHHPPGLHPFELL